VYPLNQTKRKLRKGEFVFGVGVSDVRGITLPHILAGVGFDFLFFDMEHSADGFEPMCNMIWTSRTAGITPIPRVPDPVRFYISRPLDAGAQGVVVPRVETVTQVDDVVSFCRYPPLGTRGVALGGRHVDYQAAEDQQKVMSEANDEVLVGIQIETGPGLDRVEELGARPGIDLIFIGPQDLSVALGVPGQYSSAKMDRAIQQIAAAGIRNGVPIGILARNIELAARWMEMGIRFIVFGNVVLLLKQAAGHGIRQLRELTSKIAKETVS